MVHSLNVGAAGNGARQCSGVTQFASLWQGIPKTPIKHTGAAPEFGVKLTHDCGKPPFGGQLPPAVQVCTQIPELDGELGNTCLQISPIWQSAASCPSVQKSSSVNVGDRQVFL
jgi:hypothetical protein